MRAALAAAALLVGALVGVFTTPAGAQTSVSFVGHGYGHGRGMGQYGALGYAIDDGWNYHQILDHFYGGTVVGSVPTSSTIDVDITDRDGKDTTVVQERGEVQVGSYITCTAGVQCAVKVLRTGPGTFELFRGTACTSAWTLVAQNIHATTMVVTATKAGSNDRGDMLQLCETNGRRWFRGDIWAIETGVTQATVNHLPLDSYVRGVVPRE